ncbi:MAG: universal stress protein, partial [Anaerolineae bacterium]|nr:universal stress protein [Anaerolineae bacterium]
ERVGQAGALPKLAVLVYFGTYEVITRVVIVILFLLLTSPVGAHMIGRSAYICGVGWYPKTTRYDLERVTVVCATRGGPQSDAVHARAIELASERRGELVFLHVLDTTALGGLSQADGAVVLRQLRAMAEAVLHAALAQANAAGLTARAELREGDVASTITAFVREVDADMLVVGYPHTAPGREHEAEERLWRLLGGLQEQEHVRLLVAR